MTWTLRFAALSVQISRSALLAGLCLMALLLAAALLAVQTGNYPLSSGQMAAVLQGGGTGIEQMILLDHRLPRIAAALGAGAAFGLAGAMFQTMLRNPLAAPDVIGFNAGASCGALAAMILTGGMMLAGAIAGAALAAALVLLLSWKDGLAPGRLILTGIGTSLTLAAAADLLVSRIDPQTASDMVTWLTGSLHSRGWADAARVWAGLALLAPVLWRLHFPLARLAMDDGIATGLGLPVSGLRLAVAGAGILLTALAVTAAGPLPFVAFAAGPIARRLVPSGKPALLAAAAAGALMTLLADTAARMMPGVQLPAGVFTALTGAPVLLWLLLAHFRKGTL
ncbi:FecCD family ABC transporter permease [Leisingera aquaemixtae]|uniref:FecCD family ABC transporter permease n=1 Tax=Leisingera aquaemixtae TaxID=1396826 RepID=UPI0021A6B4E1|nr:iron chelate uptake ABC transporter family permease subunit [Leisingera aquaemixtae]UWQ47923.1 iron chelate uptake ABC transporter family permease subunit [Leisingera aquaemixtae]